MTHPRLGPVKRRVVDRVSRHEAQSRFLVEDGILGAFVWTVRSSLIVFRLLPTLAWVSRVKQVMVEPDASSGKRSCRRAPFQFAVLP